MFKGRVVSEFLGWMYLYCTNLAQDIMAAAYDLDNLSDL